MSGIGSACDAGETEKRGTPYRARRLAVAEGGRAHILVTGGEARLVVAGDLAVGAAESAAARVGLLFDGRVGVG